MIFIECYYLISLEVANIKEKSISALGRKYGKYKFSVLSVIYVKYGTIRRQRKLHFLMIAIFIWCNFGRIDLLHRIQNGCFILIIYWIKMNSYQLNQLKSNIFNIIMKNWTKLFKKVKVVFQSSLIFEQEIFLSWKNFRIL